MEKLDSRRIKWSDDAINLLISIWSNEQIQEQLNSAKRNQNIWESIARFMTRKGYEVSGCQCRTRIKNMLALFKEAKRRHNASIIEPYFEVFEKCEKFRNTPKKETKHIGDNLISESEMDEIEERIDAVDESMVEYEERLDDTTVSTEDSNVQNSIQLAFSEQTKLINQILQAHTEKIKELLENDRQERIQLNRKIDLLMTKLNEQPCPTMAYIIGDNKTDTVLHLK